MADRQRQAIYDHIDAQLDEHIERLRTWIARPSISNTGEGIQQCAEKSYVAAIYDYTAQTGGSA